MKGFVKSLFRHVPLGSQRRAAGRSRKERQAHLEELLRIHRPLEEPPDGLRDAILARVRQAGITRRTRGGFRWQWLAAPALALLLVGVGLRWRVKMVHPTASDHRSLTGANAMQFASALADECHSMAQRVPAATVAPLERELALVHEVAGIATETAFASLPAGVSPVDRGNHKSQPR